MQAVRVNVVRSLFVPGIDTLVLSDLQYLVSKSREGPIIINDTGCRIMQRVIATGEFSHGKKRLQDKVKVKTKSSSEDAMKEMWVANALQIVAITAPDGSFAEPRNRKNVILLHYSALDRT